MKYFGVCHSDIEWKIFSCQNCDECVVQIQTPRIFKNLLNNIKTGTKTLLMVRKSVVIY